MQKKNKKKTAWSKVHMRLNSEHREVSEEQREREGREREGGRETHLSY